VRLATGLTTAALLATAASAAIAAPSPSRSAVRAQQLALLDHSKEAFSKPDTHSRRLETVPDVRPITGDQTVLPVIARATGKHGVAWVRVLLPGRPNGHAGWISTSSTTAAITKWRIIVRLSTRTVTAFHAGRLAHAFKAVVGKPSTPTPLGRFFVEEPVRLDRGHAGAPYALALSARSNVLQEFDGGPGQIALHGTDNVGGIPGTAVSHGCIRLSTQAISWLANRIGPGTRVTITR
jgi:lipoprotein-anchoring transpeptidase ErfK/SrfK